MEGSAPKEIIQYTGQHDEELHHGVSSHLNQAGFKAATPQSVSPDVKFPLESITKAVGDMTKGHLEVIGGDIEAHLSGESAQTYVRTGEGKIPTAISKIREALKRRLFKGEKTS